MDHFRGQILFALGVGDAERLAELLGELYRISLQTPNNKKRPTAFQDTPSTFRTLNAID
jgi:hypothetical protein